MPTNRNEEMMVYCSFCGKNQDEVQKIIAGNNAFICNECVELAQEIIREELAEEVLADLSEVPKPQELLHILNHYVIGQERAKRALAVAVYNHYKRINFHDSREEDDVELQKSNILMIGPTGVGKTEIARRLAKLANAPFIKVEATKFTEVGYVGKEVDSIIRDLTDSAMKLVRQQEIAKNRAKAEDAAEDRILDALLPPPKNQWGEVENHDTNSSTRQAFRKKLREGQLDDKEIEIDVSAGVSMGVEIMAPPGMEEMTNQLQSMFQSLGSDKTKKRKMKIKEKYNL